MSPETISLGTRTYTILFPDLASPLTTKDWAKLRKSIRLRGVVQPVVVDEEDQVIDGRARLHIVAEMKLTNLPCNVSRGLTAEGKRLLALSLNAGRKLKAAQRRELVSFLLQKAPARPDAQIAREAKADIKTVAAERRRLEAASAIPRLTGTEAGGPSVPLKKAQNAYGRLTAAEKRQFRRWLKMK
jgi:ParB-like chromosome segregation protein Spo0J